MHPQGRVAVITGAATGIGRATAEAMARDGAAVTVNTWPASRDKAAEVVADIEKAGGKGLAVEADVSKQDEVQHLIAATVEQFDRLDIMVNNAGVEKEQPFLEMPLDVWNWVIAVDLTGPWLCSQAAARQMVKQGGGGRIINISSVHEDLPMPTNAPYCAAKGGLRMLMRTIAVELAPHQITVNNIGARRHRHAPGRAGRSMIPKDEEVAGGDPARRWVSPKKWPNSRCTLPPTPPPTSPAPRTSSTAACCASRAAFRAAHR